MPVQFNSLLAQVGIVPPAVRLLRHRDFRSTKGRTPYELWRDDRPAFESYQAIQSFNNRSKLRGGDYWASFVVTPSRETLFAGLYACCYLGKNDAERVTPHTMEAFPARTMDIYELMLDDRLNDLAGRLVIAWGDLIAGVSCARLRFRAAIRSITGGGVMTSRGLMGRPFSLVSISPVMPLGNGPGTCSGRMSPCAV